MSEPTDQTPPQSHAAAPPLGRALGGDLKCIVCGYNLKGISIRGRCPECGVRVRATILSIVDPLASELRPIPHRRVVAGGLVLWAVCALLAALLCWLPHALELAGRLGIAGPTPIRASTLVFVLILLAGVGAIGLARPHAGVPIRTTALCLLGALLHIPLAWTIAEILSLAESSRAWSFVHGWRPSRSDAVLGTTSAALLAATLLLLRPAIRLLVARSLVMRTGRVDRQTLYAMAACAALLAAGHALGYWSSVLPGVGSVIGRTLALTLLVFGSLLLTIGFAGSVADAVRIAGAVLIPSPTLSSVIRHGHDPGSAIMAMAPPVLRARSDADQPAPSASASPPEPQSPAP